MPTMSWAWEVGVSFEERVKGAPSQPERVLRSLVLRAMLMPRGASHVLRVR